MEGSKGKPLVDGAVRLHLRPVLFAVATRAHIDSALTTA